jgi:hypothetical protein
MIEKLLHAWKEKRILVVVAKLFEEWLLNTQLILQ